MNKKNNQNELLHPYFGVKFHRWGSDIFRYGIDYRNIKKYKKITQYSIKLIPYMIREKFKYDGLINKQKIEKEPVFVIGHWRSGTTHLQNILTQDPQWAYLNTIQSVFPNVFLLLEKRLASMLPDQKRAMDNVKLSAYTPSEEEIALATMCNGSFWQGYFFTNEMDYYFNKYVLFEGMSQSELRHWKKGYLKLLKKLSYRYQGKQLLLKNPPNTARIKVLLEMFPNAKFIHICRNPYDVYQSRVKQYDSAVRMKDLQNLSKEDWTQKSLRYYQLLMDKYIQDRELIPEGNLVEVSFENLKENPMDITKKIYGDLNLPGYEVAKVHFAEYVKGLKKYEQNHYDYSVETTAPVRKNWLRYGEIFGYNMDTLNIAKESS